MVLIRSLEGAVVRAGSSPDGVMSLYHNADYTDPYSEGAVSLPLGSALYVGVSAEDAASDGFAVILESCYATPTPESDGASRFSLIQNRSVPSYHQQISRVGVWSATKG